MNGPVQGDEKMTTSTTITTFAEAQEVLARALPGYERRTEQEALAAAIENSIGTRRHLLAEAGTGTGKSLGYLIPAVLSGQRVVIATATKALQDQIWNKDIPLLQEHLMPFTAALLKGRSNYVCVNRFLSTDPSELSHYSEIHKIIFETGDPLMEFNTGIAGERTDFPEMENWEWAKLTASSDDCQAFGCPSNGLCYAQEAKSRAAASRVVVVNHAFYATDLYIQEVTGGAVSLLGPHDILVLDEAHEFEEYATSSLSSTFREAGMRNLSSEIMNFAHRNGFKIETRDFDRAIGDLWAVLEEGRIGPQKLLDMGDQVIALVNALIDLQEAIKAHRAEGEASQDKKRVSNRLRSMTDRFREFIEAPFDELVRYVEVERKRNQTQLVIKTAPISVADYLREKVFGVGYPTAILVSATLKTNGSMDFTAGRLGVDEYDSLDVGTPFDYETQALTYVPASMPDPSRERAAWSAMAQTEIADLLRASDGRAFVLFTSYREMEDAFNALNGRLPYQMFMQGHAPNQTLIENFKATPNSVLFGTRSFMTGVDIPGDALKLVIINKLPFPVPTEPVTEARCEVIEANGGSPFRDYTVPVMTLVLKQAYGRLIRTKTDTGVVAILDPRLISKGYGKGILKSLPEAPLVTTFAEVRF